MSWRGDYVSFLLFSLCNRSFTLFMKSASSFHYSRCNIEELDFAGFIERQIAESEPPIPLLPIEAHDFEIPNGQEINLLEVSERVCGTRRVLSRSCLISHLLVISQL